METNWKLGLTPMPEDVIFSDGNVSVTTSRFAVGGATYVIRNMTAVAMTVTSPRRALPVILIVVGLLFAFAFLRDPTDRPQEALATVAAFIVPGLVWLAAVWKNAYNVTVVGGGGAIHALTSDKKEYIEKVVEALNEAIGHYN